MITPPPSLADIVTWDIANWSKALAFWERSSRIHAADARALEFGTGGGGLSLWLAHKGFRVICSDVAGPDQRAKELHARYGMNDRIEYQVVDATNIPFQAEFDIVCFKSVLGAVGTE